VSCGYRYGISLPACPVPAFGICLRGRGEKINNLHARGHTADLFHPHIVKKGRACVHQSIPAQAQGQGNGMLVRSGPAVQFKALPGVRVLSHISRCFGNIDQADIRPQPVRSRIKGFGLTGYPVDRIRFHLYLLNQFRIITNQILYNRVIPS
jgi:hypothetical protein